MAMKDWQTIECGKCKGKFKVLKSLLKGMDKEQIDLACPYCGKVL